MYSELVMEHFRNPRNMGVIEDADGVGEVGNPQCGDMMRITIKVKDDVLEDIKFQTLGCGAAVATSSMVTEMAKGKKLDEALDDHQQGRGRGPGRPAAGQDALLQPGRGWAPGRHRRLPRPARRRVGRRAPRRAPARPARGRRARAIAGRVSASLAAAALLSPLLALPAARRRPRSPPLAATGSTPGTTYSADLDGDGACEQILIDGTPASLTITDGDVVYHSRDKWQVVEACLGDTDRDGLPEVVTLLDADDGRHLGLFAYFGGEYRERLVTSETQSPLRWRSRSSTAPRSARTGPGSTAGRRRHGRAHRSRPRADRTADRRSAAGTASASPASNRRRDAIVTSRG